MELPPDFSEFFDCLDAQRAEYLVVGAYALALHGAPRFTGDIDVLIRPTPENATRVLDAIAAFRISHRAVVSGATVPARSAG